MVSMLEREREREQLDVKVREHRHFLPLLCFNGVTLTTYHLFRIGGREGPPPSEPSSAGVVLGRRSNPPQLEFMR
jgi:hypothetical protein